MSNDTLIIGDSHVRRLGQQYSFDNCDIFGVRGLYSGELLSDDYKYRMLLYDRVSIMVGGNDVCDFPRLGHVALLPLVPIGNLNGLIAIMYT